MYDSEWNRNRMAYEWRKELIKSKEPLTWEHLEPVFSKFIPTLQKFSFKPVICINYTCMYRSDIPSQKFILKNKNDVIVFYSCIHNFELKMVIDGETFRSGALPVAAQVMKIMFRDFLVEKYQCHSSLNSTDVLKVYPNEVKLIYNPYQTTNANLLHVKFKRISRNLALILAILSMHMK